jgi:hypothetical protein
MRNCISASYQWVGVHYHFSASVIQRKWFKYRLKQRLRTWRRIGIIKDDLVALAMHPDRAGTFQDISREWFSKKL